MRHVSTTLFNMLAFGSGHAIPSLPKKSLTPLLPAHLQNLETPTSPLIARSNVTATRPRMSSQLELRELTQEERQGMVWEKQIEYSGRTFFDGWEFFSEPDPTHGLIKYVTRDQAFKDGLVFWTQDGTPGLQVEHWRDTPVGTPRHSVRIHSKGLFAGGLFIIDMRLMPWGCAVWPACGYPSSLTVLTLIVTTLWFPLERGVLTEVWTLGYEKEWPHAGEMDIIEGIQSASHNQMTLHTTPGCNINSSRGLFTGNMRHAECDALDSKSGCSIISASDESYGMRFNELGGGAFAMQWNGDGVKMWDWTRARIPSDILEDRPNPRIWGTPAAAWDASTCDPYVFFGAQQLILNINLCGEWAGALYNQFSYCQGTCEEYASNHLNLNNTVMLVNFIKVYQQADTDHTIRQADGVGNLTGVGAPIPGNGTSFNRNPSSSAISWSQLPGLQFLVVFVLASMSTVAL